MIRELLRLRPGAEFTRSDAGELTLSAPPHAASLGPAGDAAYQALKLLADGPCDPAELPAAGPLLDRLRGGGWLVVDVATGDGPLYTLHPARPPEVVPRGGDAAQLVLSRFVVLHRDGDHMVAESPVAAYDVHIQEPALLAAFAALARPVPADGATLPLPAPVAARLLTDLRAAGLAVPAGGPEETELRLRQWSPFELWLHDRSRLGARAAATGRWGPTGWLEADFPPLPARPQPFGGPTVPLYRPDLAALRATDPTFTAVLEDRRSVREHDADHPLHVEQLGEFLYRCARVRGVAVLDGIEHLDRPFPSGGAVHELEIYPVVNRVTGLAPGLYHYDGHEHRLEAVSGDGPAVRRLLELAELATGATAPQVLLVVTARFGRLMTKYEGMGYAAILKDVGVLYQTMYGVATAMGLAPCGIGGGDAAVFNAATGRDYLTESVVGEFLLGSRPAAPDGRARHAPAGGAHDRDGAGQDGGAHAHDPAS
ncbi:MAG TPA: SagB family peptide dehydrogenase [Pilimelia sp.]|nr:SagB family peptide dehydrogenase [Pilimelia sp.]